MMSAKAVTAEPPASVSGDLDHARVAGSERRGEGASMILGLTLYYQPIGADAARY